MKQRPVNSPGRRVSPFARSLRREWRELGLPLEAARVVLGVSGGADSCALLLAFAELRLDLEVVVAHLDHGLRGEAGARDARWVARLSQILNFKFEIGNVELPRGNTEQTARLARYRFLEKVATDYSAALVAVAHTVDDQAETILLNLLRGSGLDGLTGMEAVRALGANDVRLVRPLLRWARRADTVAYCRERGVRPRADAMNRDETYARVRARRKLIPLLETFNVRVAENLARTARLLGEDADFLQNEAAKLLRTAGGPDMLRVSALASAPAALRRRALRQWIAAAKGDAKRLTLAHLVAVEKLLFGEGGGRVVELPGELKVERRRGEIRLLFKSVEKGCVRSYNP